MKRDKVLSSSAAAVCALALAASAASADELKATARSVAEKAQKTVVTVKLVLKLHMAGREQEVKHEVTGTVIDPTGLTVVSAGAVDPGAALRLGGGGRRGGGGGGGGAGGGIESEVTEAALILDDGTEVEADVVLKDPELDLAFIRPRDPAAKLESVVLKPREKAPQVLDDVFVVGRLGRVANRAVSVTVGTIRSVVKGPRTFCVCDDAVSTGNTGCFAYAADGTPLGIFVTKIKAGERGMGRGEALTVLRLVDDVIEAAKEAKTAKPLEKKKPTDGDKAGEDGAKKDGGAKPEDAKKDKAEKSEKPEKAEKDEKADKKKDDEPR